MRETILMEGTTVKHWLAGILILAVLATRFAGAEEKGKKADEDLGQAILQGIAMLEAKEYEKFLERYVPPADKARMLEYSAPPGRPAKSMKEIAQEFGKENGERLLAVLKFVKDQKPEFSEEGAKANFTPPKAVHKVEFKKVDGKWYVSN